MTKLKEFYKSFGFIITFMFLSVLISALFGEKFLNKFLLLVLASQLLLNSDKATELINKVKISNEKVTSNNNNNNNKKVALKNYGSDFIGPTQPITYNSDFIGPTLPTYTKVTGDVKNGKIIN